MWKNVARCILLFFMLTGCVKTTELGVDISMQRSDFNDSAFDTEETVETNDVLLDFSHLNNGYVGVKSDNEAKLKLESNNGTQRYFTIYKRENPFILPVTEDGEYSFRLWSNVEENRYKQLWETNRIVKLNSELEPFLTPNEYVDYSNTSPCVEFAHGVYTFSEGKTDFINKIINFVVKTIKYDKEKIYIIEGEYVSNPDVTYKEEKGICLDYSVLAAAMLRSQGIPTKVDVGYVYENGEKESYHAWNEIYIDGEWVRYDLTFLANGSTLDFVSDDSNYKVELTY